MTYRTWCHEHIVSFPMGNDASREARRQGVLVNTHLVKATHPGRSEGFEKGRVRFEAGGMLGRLTDQAQAKGFRTVGPT